MSKVRKAIIPAAGLGTRFLPATKAMPKEMLPILTKPTIQYIVEEAVASGIEQIIIVSGRSKRAIEDHFDHAPELENILRQKGKLDLLKEVDASTTMAEIHYIRQKEPKGLGHAIWSARHFIGDEPFAVLLGDDIIVSEEPGLKQLMDQYEELDASVVGVRQVPIEDTHRYGIIDPLNQTGRRYQVRQFVEKPVQGTAPSNMAIIGRYILTPAIFEYLATQEAGTGGEIQLTDAIERLNGQEDVYGYEVEGKRFDVGEKMGYVETTLAFALEDAEIQADVRQLLKRYVESWEQE
ncbi:UTP-glucose-1-phosphate uridylyltransferase [Exiguobacterium sibiricum 255-15]|uniref:UTP--glucose-1-phosphate uridylyltransferase n=1 Tax=Exiguobacterium sibiricum (strain DSM 17290 / CCUG 55495 / CIP 109462 / JCM 13490 / 255-15) TaxID=262543 RepID=B1YMH7_EXIS2|nr:UTP--glucose-1-phosphate uridylyltransferase GalU [Exiguobacterium sibiricum]ACB62037.1 UTP-glucose-1-phosphate uridylyltransferase [Exiguobacterium sibiricum 255-15]